MEREKSKRSETSFSYNLHWQLLASYHLPPQQKEEFEKR
jgi:hypothetical protein